MNTKQRLCAGAALITTMAFGAAAHAEGAAADNSASRDNGGRVEEVVVTATRKETLLQKTPIAVSAFSQSALDKQNVKDVTDLARFVPSLAFNQQGDQSAVMLTLRGIGNDAAFTEVADPEVAIYVDGIYSPRAQGASVLMYDMERVEVLRGPQGTLFGRNATVGAVNLITAKPVIGSDFGGYLEGIAGSYARASVRGAINIPVSDTFALRLAFIEDRHDGYADFQQPPTVPGVAPSAFVTQGKKYYAADQRSGRLSAIWKPSDKFTWNLSVEGYQDTGAPVIGLMQDPRPGEKIWSTLSDTAPEQDRWSAAVRSQMDYDFNDAVRLSYIAGYTKIGGSTNTDTDAGTLPPTGPNSPGGAFQENHTVWSSYEFMSHELQLKSTGQQAIDWILGAYYSHEKNAIRFDVDIRNGYRNGTFGWAGSFIQADREIDSLAGFGQATWHISDRIRLTGGLRYTKDTKEDVGGRNVTFAGCPSSLPPGSCESGIFGQFPDATAEELVNLLPGYAISPNDVKGDWGKLTWLARADADISDDILGYASVGTGFKSGNIQDGGQLTDPETLTNYEVGLKTWLFDRRATLNLAAYYSDFKGYQVNQAVTFRDANGNIISSQLVTQNAKGAKAYGLEMELNANLTDNDRLQFAGALQKTRLDELLSIDGRVDNSSDPTAVQELEGNELAHAPHFSGTVTYEHDFDLANGAVITPRITSHFESKSWLSYFNGDRTNRIVGGVPVYYGNGFDQQKAYSRTDLSLRYASPNDRYEVEAFVLNIEDRKIRTGAGSFGGPATPVFLSVLQPPRTWGVRVKASF